MTGREEASKIQYAVLILWVIMSCSLVSNAFLLFFSADFPLEAVLKKSLVFMIFLFLLFGGMLKAFVRVGVLHLAYAYEELREKCIVYEGISSQAGADEALAILAHDFHEACQRQIKYLSQGAHDPRDLEEEVTKGDLERRVEAAKKRFWEFHEKIRKLDFLVRPSYKDYLPQEIAEIRSEIHVTQLPVKG